MLISKAAASKAPDLVTSLSQTMIALADDQTLDLHGWETTRDDAAHEALP